MSTRNRLCLSLLVAAMVTGGAARAQSVMFDFDSGAPVLKPGTKTPIAQEFNMEGIGMVRYEMSAPNGGFVIADAKSLGVDIPPFSGNFLWPVSDSSTAIDIRFDRLMTQVTLSFVSLDNGDAASPVTFTAYQDFATNPPVLTLITRGTRNEAGFSGGSVTFATEGKPFDLVRVTVKPGIARGVAIDTIRAGIETCQADFDGDDAKMALLAQADIFAYLNAWFCCELRADFNHDGAMNAQDIFDFLNAWFAGCPQTGSSAPTRPLMHVGPATEINETGQ